MSHLRENDHGRIRTAGKSLGAPRMVAPPDPASERGQPECRRVLPPPRRQHGDVLRLETPLPRGTTSLPPRSCGTEGVRLRDGRGQTLCAPWKGVDLQWVQFPPGNWFASAGSYRS